MPPSAGSSLVDGRTRRAAHGSVSPMSEALLAPTDIGDVDREADTSSVRRCIVAVSVFDAADADAAF